MSASIKTILLVEDEALIALSETKQLESAGYRVIHSLSGENAVGIVQGRQFDIDLILMDVDLGRGIDGTEAARRILASSDIPILFLSSHKESEIVHKTERITSYGYVVKSASFTILDASIKMALKLFDAQKRINAINMEYEAINEELSVSLESLQATNRQLALSESKFNKVFQVNPDCMAISRLSDGTLVHVNRGFCRTLGYAEDELIGRSYLPRGLGIWPGEEDRARVLALLEEKGEVANFETRFTGKDGSSIVGLLSASVVESEGVRLLVSSIKDITERERLEEVLRRSEERFRLAMEATTDGVWDLDVPTGKVYYSPAYHTMLGYGEEEFHGDGYGWTDYIHPEDLASVRAANTECIEGRCPSFGVEFRMRCKDGSWKWITSRGRAAARDGEGRALRMIGTHVDITERKKAEAEYRILFEEAGDAMAITDHEDRILEVNARLVERLGYTKEELLSMRVSRFDESQGGETAAERLDRVRKTGSFSFRTTQKRKDGSIVPVEINSLTIVWKNEPAVLSISRDITEQLRAEEYYNQAQAVLRSTMDSRNDIYILSIDRDFNCLYCNNALRDIRRGQLGISTDIGGNLLARLFEDPFLRTALPYYQKALRGESSRVVQDHGDVGIHLDSAFNPIRSPDGEILGATWISLNISESKKLERELEENKDRYHDLLDAIGEGFCYIDENEVFRMANRSAERIFRVEPDSLVGKRIYDFLDEEGEHIAKREIEKRKTGESTEYVTPIVRSDGQRRFLRINASPITREDRRYVGNSVILRDISDELRVSEDLNRLVTNKETLMKELEHRVNNSLNLVSSLLGIARNELGDEQAKSILSDTEARIRSMAAIYERLYLSEGVASLDFGTYVEGLAQSIFATFSPESRRIRLVTEIRGVEIDTKRAISLGLIVNELLTNAMKHAFPDGRGGTIRVSLDEAEGEVKLAVADDGVGLGDGDVPAASTTMGMTLIRLLASQVGADLRTDISRGTAISLAFPMRGGS